MHDYFFDVFDGAAAIIDDHGESFVDKDEAVEHVKSLIVDIVREASLGESCQDFGVSLRNDSGDEVYRAAIFFRDTHIDPDRLGSPPVLCSTWTVTDSAESIRRSRAVSSTSRQSADQLREAVDLPVGTGQGRGGQKS